MFFTACYCDRRIAAAYKYVVSYGIIKAVVVVKAVAGQIITNVIFNQQIAAAFIGINTPATIVLAFNIVNQVTADDCARLLA